MRYVLMLALLTTACTDVPGNGPRYASVRERLSAAPASLFVQDEASSGAITARRRAGLDSWVSGAAPITIEHGYVRATIDDTDQLAIDQLEIAVAPITLDGVFQKPAQLLGVRLRLAERARSQATWTSADEVTATLVMELDFDWSIAFDGGEAYPLATQHLPPQSVDVVLAGERGHVAAFVDIDAKGILWNWADLVQVTDLSLAVTAETAD